MNFDFFPIRSIKLQVTLFTLVILLLYVCSLTADAAVRAPQRIVVLHSYHADFAWTDDIMKGIHKVFDKSDQNAEFFVEYMDTKRFPKQLDKEQLASIQQHLTEKYRSLQPHVVIIVDDDALRFMLDRHEAIFPRVPVVFCGVNNPVDDGKIAASKVITGVMEVLDRKETIDAALALHPGTKKLAVITDTTTNGIGNRLILKELAKLYEGRIKFDFLDENGTGITLEELRSRLSKLDDDSIVYYGDFFRDKNGFLDQTDIIPILSRESRRPIYSPYSIIFGLGTVGGKLNSALFQGEKAAQIAIQILNGTSPSQIPVVKESINHFMFDFRQMARWNITKDNLPADSIVMYKSPSIFEQYRQLVIATLIAFIILISVIAALVVSVYHRKQAESFLRVSEGRYRTLIEQMPDMIWQKDTDGNYLSCNSNYAKMLGVTLETINGHRDEDFYRPELAAKYRTDDRSVVMTGQQFEAEELWEQSGETHYLLISKVPLFDEKGAIIGTIGIGRDITDQKETETKLLRNETRLKSLVEILQFPVKTIREFLDNALNEAVKLTDSTVGYIYFYHEERQEFELNSWSKEVMIECTVLEYQSIYHLDKTGIWGEAVRQRKPIVVNDFTTENSLRKGYPRGHVHLTRFMTVPIFSNDKIVAVVGVANKASDYDEENVLQLTLLMNSVWKHVESKRGEEERDKLESQLHQAQKMESVGSLAGGVAHDFNNKLSVILGCTYLASAESDPAKQRHFLEEIRKAAEQSADLTRQLLAFARKQTIVPKVLDLNETVTGMLKMLSRLIGEDIHLTWQPEPNLWLLKFDPSQVDQILANLCVNARDSISRDGKIIIETGNSIIDEVYCARHVDVLPGEYVWLAVSDNGCGMNKETMDRIFEPFFTTKEAGKGTGLGLATVFGIVKQNQGFINVDSEPGTGTTFTIYLPRYVGQSVQNNKDNLVMSAPVGLETILIVEDELAILNMASTLLSKQGYTVLSANTHQEAIRLAKENAGEISLLITDVIMPEMNGKDLAQKLLSLYPQLKKLFMSGYTADAIAQHGVLDEGVNFIQKPFSLAALATKVREVLDSKSETT